MAREIDPHSDASADARADAAPETTAVAKLVLAYDGTDFHGWQIQPGLRTVQGELIERLKKLMPLDGIPPGAGRTDAGVHASGQVCSVPLPDASYFVRLERSLARMLPGDIVLREIQLEGPEFHARFSATARRYRYRFHRKADPFLRRNHVFLPDRVDLEAMARACAPLVGDHDATSLCRTASLEPGRTRCVIRRAQLEFDDEGACFEIEADRFLHSMVRIIVGTVLEVGHGRRDVDCFGPILAARDRNVAGATAPAHGLSLEEVRYEGRRPDGGPTVSTSETGTSEGSDAGRDASETPGRE